MSSRTNNSGRFGAVSRQARQKLVFRLINQTLRYGGVMAIEVGHVFPKKTFVVAPHRVAEYVTALGVTPEDNWTPEIGQAVPLGFFMYVTSYGADDVHDYLNFNLLNTVYGGTDAEFLEPVCIGDVLTVYPVISSLTVKESKGKTLTFAEITCEYVNEHGRIAVIERSNTVEKVG
jgi:hypothetical protein